MFKKMIQGMRGLETRAREAERGNVLFLILIAVALFAALSYAVTQSSRSGAGGTDGESNLVNSAQLTQYPASVRTAVVRMMIAGIDASQMEFNPPSDFTNLTDVDGLKKYGVFHPDGGGATFVTAAPDVMASGGQGGWIFTSDYQIENIGTTAAAATANDIIAFLPGVGLSICTKLNEQLGISVTDDTDGNGVPDAGSTAVPTSANAMVAPGNTGIGAYAAGNVLDLDFSGQAFGCADFADATAGTAAGDLVYYHVLVER